MEKDEEIKQLKSNVYDMLAEVEQYKLKIQQIQLSMQEKINKINELSGAFKPVLEKIQVKNVKK